MKFFTLCTLLFFAGLGVLGCDSSNTGLAGSPDNPDEFIVLNCDGFFDSGDYSSMCFVEGVTPIYRSEDFGCLTRLGIRPDSAGSEAGTTEISVTFLDGVSSAIASDVFADDKERSADEIGGTVMDISGIGDEAYVLDVEEDNVGSKYLLVRYRNLLLSFRTDYTLTNQPSCSHTNSEFEKLSKLVIENIDANRQ
ncbi:MAG: hypothetical protein JKY56_10165 [Kofleriaceae bacterium]|nr:hypothetical protein [Kofleriaceae bacterium]